MKLLLNSTPKLKSVMLNAVVTGVAALIMSGAVSLAAPQTAIAQEAAPQEGRQFGAKAGEKVNEALQFLNSDQHAAALGKLSEALAIPDLNAYERGTIYQMQGQAHYELDNYSGAITAFENAINSGGLLPTEIASLRVSVAQLLIGNGQQARGAQMLEDWSRSGGQLKPQHIEMLWQAWIQVEQYSRALPWAERWFNAANPKERKHFDILNFLYNNLNMPGKQADIVKQMINRWPEDVNLWTAWASMLANGGREQEAFEVSKMLYLGGAYNTQADLERVVQYYSYYDMPFQAAQILEKEMNAGRIQQSPEKLVQLSDLLRQAREYEKAIPILQKAASSSGKGKLYADWGEALYNLERCDEAETALRRAMELGYNRGKATMLIANCRYNKASSSPRLKCKANPNESKAQRETRFKASERFKWWDKAMESFDSVPVSSSEAGNARKWKTFITGERQGLYDRCQFEDDVRKDLCFEQIRQAYDAEFLEGKFVLSDQTCSEFVPAYDKLYRIKVEPDANDG